MKPTLRLYKRKESIDVESYERTKEYWRQRFNELIHDGILYLLANDNLKRRFYQVEAGTISKLNKQNERDLGKLAQLGIIYVYLKGTAELTPAGVKISQELKKHILF